MEYKIIETYQDTGKTEVILNDLAGLGWTVRGFDRYQILLERSVNKTLNEGSNNQASLF